jgi:beta-glucosidase
VPLREIAAHAPTAHVTFNDGTDPAAAAIFAKSADVAIVFVTQYMREEVDAPNLSLSDNQDALVAAVASANPHTIVVIESGGPVLMPWSENVAGILEAWYPGIGGAQAIANILFGSVNPSGKLPATFARSEADLPHPILPGSTRDFPAGTSSGTKNHTKGFDIDYSEGARVGYKWFDSENKPVLYPFGYGLSYTTFAYSNLSSDSSGSATITIKNTGKRAGTEIAQVYGQLPGENYKRLAGWQRVTLAPSESKTIHVAIDGRTLSTFDDKKDAWSAPPNGTQLYAGPSSRELPLHVTMQ